MSFKAAQISKTNLTNCRIHTKSYALPTFVTIVLHSRSYVCGMTPDFWWCILISNGLKVILILKNKLCNVSCLTPFCKTLMRLIVYVYSFMNSIKKEWWLENITSMGGVGRSLVMHNCVKTQSFTLFN